MYRADFIYSEKDCPPEISRCSRLYRTHMVSLGAKPMPPQAACLRGYIASMSSLQDIMLDAARPGTGVQGARGVYTRRARNLETRNLKMLNLKILNLKILNLTTTHLMFTRQIILATPSSNGPIQPR